MALVFQDTHTFKVDSKGRVSIPAPYRRVLSAGDPDAQGGDAPQVVIVYGDDRRNFLECMTVEEFGVVSAKIRALPEGTAARKALDRLYHGRSFTTSVDPTGRLVLPARVRQKIGIEDEALFVGKGHRFEIWRPETYWAEDEALAEAFYASLPEGFDETIFLDQPELAREGLARKPE